MRSKLLDLAYYGEVFFARMQGIGFDNPRRNGEYLLIRRLGPVVRFAVDAGANRGEWSARVITATKGQARLACIEPDPRNANLLRKRFSGNGAVDIHEAALSASVSSRSFRSVGEEGSGTGHLLTGPEPAALQVGTITLDWLAEHYGGIGFDLVKCDIEGEEIPALRGAERLFRSSLIGTMQIEYNATWLRAGHRLQEAFEFAADHNYTLLAATPWGFSKYGTYGQGLDDFRMRNLVIARRDHVALLKGSRPAGGARVADQGHFG
jgi:FkbM family methyltransferase